MILLYDLSRLHQNIGWFGWNVGLARANDTVLAMASGDQ